MRRLPELRAIATALIWIGGTLVVGVAGAEAAEPLKPVKETLYGIQRVLFDSSRPTAPRDRAVESLAREIDWLERLIETYGTVVPKHPDVWGEARLTKHRQEYEREISRKFAEDEFDESLQGAIRRSDQAFLALAFSLASSGATNSAASLIPEPKEREVDDTAFSRFNLPKDGKPTLSLEPTITNDQLSRYLTHLNELRRINEGDDTADSPGYALNLVRIPVSVLPGHRTRTGYGAEITFTATPYLTNELLPSTLRSLIVNDVVDQNALPLAQVLNNDPEYARWWFRGVASHLPQVSAWMRAYDDWIDVVENTARTRGIQNELRVRRNIEYLRTVRDYLTLRLLEISIWDAYYKELDSGGTVGRLESIKVPSRDVYRKTLPEKAEPLRLEFSALTDWFSEVAANGKTPRQFQGTLKFKQGKGKGLGDTEYDVTVGLSVDVALNYELTLPQIPLTSPQAEAAKWLIGGGKPTVEKSAEKPGAIKPKDEEGPVSLLAAQLLRDWSTGLVGGGYRGEVSRLLDSASIGVSSQLLMQRPPSVAGATSRKSQRPLSSAEYIPTYGFELFSELGQAVHEGLASNPANERLVHLLDIRRFLEEETVAVYQMLDEPERRRLWSHASPELARDIRGRRFEQVRRRRDLFLKELGIFTDGQLARSLGWAIIVEAALLNEKLNEDMQKTALAKGVDWPYPEGLLFVGPRETLSEEAHEAFKTYVNLRWPVIVFALDPITQDQNIADVFSRRRELMLAVSVAVAQGQVTPSAAGRFVRRQETEIETIALNRTAVAFSHGNDTFGWRFYPRVQSPETPSTLGAFAETLIGGRTRDKDLRDRQLEPAIRECTAIVITPSFVPHVTFDSRANWFGLTNPRKKELTLQDAMRISRTSQAVQEAAMCTEDGHLYRPGDVSQLSRVVEQLNRRTPLQTKLVQIPHENKLGGFPLFETGVTSLGPVLHGWYGAPGIDPDGITTLFLVGDRFSSLENRVIAGGRNVPVKLLSRQVMEVEVPPGARPLDSGKYGRFVDVQIATSYGPSSHLLVPLVVKSPAPAAVGKLKWSSAGLKAQIAATPTGMTLAFSPPAVDKPLVLELSSPTAAVPVELTLQMTAYGVTDSKREVSLGVKSVKARFDPASGKFVVDGGGFDELAKLLQEAAKVWAAVEPLDAAPRTDRWVLRASASLVANGLVEKVDGEVPVAMTLWVNAP